MQWLLLQAAVAVSLALLHVVNLVCSMTERIEFGIHKIL